MKKENPKKEQTMILSASQLRELIRYGGEIIPPPTEKALQDLPITKPLIKLPEGMTPHTYLEGSAYDLTVGEVYRTGRGSGSFIGVEERSIPRPDCMKPQEGTQGVPAGKNYWWLPSGNFLLVSNETVNMPWNMLGLLSARTSFARSGHTMITSAISPNYQGPVTVLLAVDSIGLGLEVNARFCALRLEKIDAETFREVDIYDGIWGSGPGKNRVSTDGKKERGY